MSAQFVLAQVSDMHVRSSARDDGFDPAEAFKRVLAKIAQFEPDAIIATGDLVNDARADEYRVLAELAAHPPAPLYLVPGNHDDPGVMRLVFPDHKYLPAAGPLSYAIEDYPIRLVAVDQTVRGMTGGDFTPEHADWLSAKLAEAPNKPTVIALHHPPFSTHDRLLDTIGLAHAERLEAIVKRNPQVGLILCGHHHRPVVGHLAHVPVIVAPSSAWSFGLALKEGQAVAKRKPLLRGFALHVWTEQSGFVTHFMGI